MSRCACAACSSGNTWWMTGEQRPASSTGQTLERSSLPISAFSAAVRGRIVDAMARYQLGNDPPKEEIGLIVEFLKTLTAEECRN